MGIFSRNKSENNIESGLSEDSLKDRARVLAFLNQKGGVGKTTMAFNTAHALANQGHKVLCLDMDPQANLSLLCGVDSSHSDTAHIHQLLINSVRELKAIHSPALLSEVIVRGEKVDVLPAGSELSGFELSVAGISMARQLILKNFIDKNHLRKHYDYIVIDGPPTLGLIVVNIMCAVDALLVPFRPDEFSRKGLGHFYDVLENIEQMGVTKTPHVLAHIPNLVDMRRKQESEDLARITEELESEFGKNCVTSAFFNRAPLVKSQAQRKSVFDFNSKEFEGIRIQFDDIANRITKWNQESVHVN